MRTAPLLNIQNYISRQIMYMKSDTCQGKGRRKLFPSCGEGGGGRKGGGGGGETLHRKSSCFLKRRWGRLKPFFFSTSRTMPSLTKPTQLHFKEVFAECNILFPQRDASPNSPSLSYCPLPPPFLPQSPVAICSPGKRKAT